jgi:methionyl aminopeptidase
MRTAGLAVGRVLDAVRSHAAPGVTPRELDGIAVDLIRRAGAVSSFKGYSPGPGYPPFPAVTCISVNDSVVHGIPDDTPLASGDLVSVDFGLSIRGWHGDSALTFGVGELAEEAQRLSEVTRLAMWDGVTAARVGGRIGDIGHAVQSRVRQENPEFGVVREFTGHGIGRRMHETPPDVPNFGRPGRGERIEHGLVIAIEPIVSAGSSRVVELDDGWTVKTSDGSLAAHWEHTVAITKQGLWVLTAADGGEAELTRRGVKFAPLAD